MSAGLKRPVKGSSGTEVTPLWGTSLFCKWARLGQPPPSPIGRFRGVTHTSPPKQLGKSSVAENCACLVSQTCQRAIPSKMSLMRCPDTSKASFTPKP